MSRRRLGGVLAAAIAVSAAATAAWVFAARSGPVIQLPPGHPLNHVVETFGYVGPGMHVSDGEVIVCLSEPGSVKVLSVEPIRPIGQIKVADFGFRPNPFLTSPPEQMLGDSRGSLAQSGYTWSRNVDTACGAEDSGVGEEFAVEFTNPTGTGAAASGWRITYESAGERETFDIPIVFAACRGDGGEAVCEKLQKEADTK